jgi:imidazolonepropionase-like amidohydrolase
VEVVRGERPLFVHVHRADDILTALRIADEFRIRMVIHHGTEAHLVADELARRDIAVVSGPLLVNRAKVEMKEISLENPAKLLASGVRFSFMTDHPVVPIQYLGVQAALAVREGLPSEAAMRALTSDAAHIMGVGEELGSISPGKCADLVLWSGHPMELRSRAVKVWIDGRECYKR